MLASSRGGTLRADANDPAGGYGTRPCTGFRRFGGAGEGAEGQKYD